jgi:hypothetical protein
MHEVCADAKNDDTWITVQEIEAMSASLEKYSFSEAQTSRVMAPWIQYTRKRCTPFSAREESIRVLPYQERPK